MPINAIFSFLTYPKRHQADNAPVSGTAIPLTDDKLCKMLRDIFDTASSDCPIPIMFTSNGDKQENPVRNELLALLTKPDVATASPLATRLQNATSGTSGMGLLFICLGLDGEHTRIVISRFPADEGVVAERSVNKLTVSFVEQVFLKSSFSYKAATYVTNGKANQLWSGYVVDKQINHGSKAVADYWIVDFLHSEFSTTAAAGTKRLAQALRAVMASTSDLDIKREITSAVQLAGNLPRKAMTIADFCESFNLGEGTKRAIVAKVNPPRLVHEKFRFDTEEFARHIAYKQIELSNGAVLTAPADRFDECFRETKRREEHTFTTTGVIVDERLRKSK